VSVLSRARDLQTTVEARRGQHRWLDLGLRIVERDVAIGGSLLAGALAYRLFVLLLPTSLLLVSGLGVYAGAVDQSPRQVVRDAGLHGLIASEVGSTASDSARWLVFVLMVPATAFALVKLYRAVAIVHGIVWEGSGRGQRLVPKGVGLLGAALLLSLVAAELAGSLRDRDQLEGLGALLVYLPLVGGPWLALTLQLAHRDARWPELVPGALVVGGGLLFVNAFNVYVTTRLVEGQANTYGALGIAAALLFSLVLVGRLVILSAELSAALHQTRVGYRE
jgi:uncharacterized BrkB/YihY/UPF0761 family membrane protein